MIVFKMQKSTLCGRQETYIIIKKKNSRENNKTEHVQTKSEMTEWHPSDGVLGQGKQLYSVGRVFQHDHQLSSQHIET